MKKTFFVLALVILVLTFSSCVYEKETPPDPSTQFQSSSFSYLNGISSGKNVINKGDGFYYILGNKSIYPSFSSSVIKNIHFIKLDKFFNIVFEKTLDSLYDESITSSFYDEVNNCFVLCGYKYSDDSVKKRSGIIYKIDSQGNILMKKEFSGNNNISFNHISRTSDNSYIITGFTKSTTGDYAKKYPGKNAQDEETSDILFLKLDTSGNVIIKQCFGGTNADYGKKIIEISEKKYVLIGESRSENGDIQSNKGNYDIFIVSMDSNGNVLWKNNYGGTYIDYPCDIIDIQSKKELQMISYTSSYDGDSQDKNKNGSDILMMSINYSGNILWKKVIGIGNYEIPVSIIINKKGNIVLTSCSKLYTTYSDTYSARGSFFGREPVTSIALLDLSGNILNATKELSTQAYPISVTENSDSYIILLNNNNSTYLLEVKEPQKIQGN